MIFLLNMKGMAEKSNKIFFLVKMWTVCMSVWCVCMAAMVIAAAAVNVITVMSLAVVLDAMHDYHYLGEAVKVWRDQGAHITLLGNVFGCRLVAVPGEGPPALPTPLGQQQVAGDAVRGYQGASHSVHLHHRHYHGGQHFLPVPPQGELLIIQQYNFAEKIYSNEIL